MTYDYFYPQSYDHEFVCSNCGAVNDGQFTKICGDCGFDNDNHEPENTFYE